jgi:hypothetical protein
MVWTIGHQGILGQGDERRRTHIAVATMRILTKLIGPMINANRNVEKDEKKLRNLQINDIH